MKRPLDIDQLLKEHSQDKVPDSINGYDPEAVHPLGKPVPIDLRALGLSEGILNLIEKGPNGHYPSRSEGDAAAITALLNKGVNPNEILWIFQNYPVGEKFS